jgi:hypothetical protein
MKDEIFIGVLWVLFLCAFISLITGCTLEQAQAIRPLLPEVCAEKDGWRMCLTRVDGAPPNATPLSSGPVMVAGPECQPKKEEKP